MILLSVEPGDWLADHSEDGQTFEQYKGGKRNLVDYKKRKLYIMPLQKMDSDFLAKCQQFCAAFYYGLPVELILKADLRKLKVASRVNEHTSKIQYNASDILVAVKKYSNSTYEQVPTSGCLCHDLRPT